MKKILITTSSFGQQDSLEQHGFVIARNPHGRKLTAPEVSSLIQEHQPVGMIAGVEPLTGEVLKLAKNLKAIARCGAGMDSVDVKFAEESGIHVTSTPDAPTTAVAELTLGLILSLLRGIPGSDAALRGGSWKRSPGHQLSGKTVGIVGCGRIGTHVARLLAGFGCKLLGHDPEKETHPLCELVRLEELLARADIVSLHLPYSQTNHHLINRNRIGMLKEGAFLVNASRGGLVDEEALADRLAAGTLGGAALDCFEQEPYHGRLVRQAGTVLTAHIGSLTRECRASMEREAVDNLIRTLEELEVLP